MRTDTTHVSEKRLTPQDLDALFDRLPPSNGRRFFVCGPRQAPIVRELFPGVEVVESRLVEENRACSD